ncbi:hypothetical protein B0H19DRAFT_965734 [Mycena capillaripes]|nr:hypothetical protein B0H19DRAFT_965734 [Mycena capillaripes]
MEHRTLGQKEEDILTRYPLPSHWRRPSVGASALQRTIFSVLCMASFGHVELAPVWASIKLEEEGDESVWVEETRQHCDRLNNLLVVGSLLLATSAAFITTVPPRSATADYTLRGPYICMLSAAGMLIGGIIVTAVSFLVLTKARPNWAERVCPQSHTFLHHFLSTPFRVLYGGRFHVWSTLILGSYPIVSIGAATILLASGILSAMWASEDLALKASSLVILSVPLSMGVLFGVSCLTAKPATPLQ